MREKKEVTDVETGYVKVVTVGSIHPNRPFSEEALQEQVQLLNRCLCGYPKGKIIGKNVSVGRFLVGGHEFYMERTSYHIGFVRKPAWMDE